MNSIEHFINCKTVKGSSKRTGKVFNPATGEVSSNVNLANTADLNKAVEAAKKLCLVGHKKLRYFELGSFLNLKN